MQTICKECIFSEVSDGVQNGCNFDDRLTKYKKLGLVDKKDSEWYYTINTLCKACTKINIGQILPDDFKDIVKKNISPKIDAVVYGDNDETIISILETIKNDNYTKIIVCQPNMISLKSYHNFSQVYPKVIISSQIENRYPLEYLDNGCNKSKSDYIAIIDNKEIPNIPEVVSNLVMNELQDFVGIFPEDGLNGFVINPKIFKFLGGNFEKSIIDKIQELDNYESMIFQWNNLK